MVRRWGDKPYARCRIPQPSDGSGHLVAGELPTLAGLRALGHLDLQLVRVYQVLARHAKARRGYLLHGAAPPVPVRITREARGVFTAFAGIALATEPVHRDCEVLVRLRGDRSHGHRTCHEPVEDRLRRLDFLDRHRLIGVLEVQQSANSCQGTALIVDQPGIVLEDPILLRLRRVLKLEDRLRVEEVILTATAPLVLTAEIEVRLTD